MPMPKTFYIAHDNDMPAPWMRFYRRKPRAMTARRRYSESYVLSACIEEFTKVTGIKLKPGETKRVQLVEVKP